MAGLCEGGNEPLGSLKADSLLLMTMKPRSVERRSKIGSLGGSLMSFRHTAGSDSKVQSRKKKLADEHSIAMDVKAKVIALIEEGELARRKLENAMELRLEQRPGGGRSIKSEDT
ncbi:hypothetical protein ANN_15415 [Periplaneta americana]|uniref:Uncharacterized protein n=1 Tax=Periplaneta americana TaxID=6978 RepID=A0ABQ8SGL4_PERAM|nr:hypothetical protein ANN_15415 [Periplaneta americana]